MSAHERLFGPSRENSSSPPESPSGKKGSSISSGDSSMSPIASPIFKSDTARAIAKEVGLVDPKVRAKKRSLTITGTNPASVIEALNNHHAKVKDQFTMLQKYSKCEVKAARCGKFLVLLPLRFSVKSILTDYKVSKTAILTNLEALDFDVSEFL